MVYDGEEYLADTHGFRRYARGVETVVASPSIRGGAPNAPAYLRRLAAADGRGDATWAANGGYGYEVGAEEDEEDILQLRREREENLIAQREELEVMERADREEEQDEERRLQRLQAWHQRQAWLDAEATEAAAWAQEVHEQVRDAILSPFS